MRGDDSLGLGITKRLRNHVPQNVKLIECGSVPENYTAAIGRINPTHVLIVDAVHADMEPGTICIIAPKDINQPFMSTHTLSMHFLSKYLEKTLRVKTLILGVQVERISLGDKLSPRVRKAINEISETLISLFNEIFK